MINAADSTVDVLDIADPGTPQLVFSIDVEADFPALPVGGINSVAVHGDVVDRCLFRIVLLGAHAERPTVDPRQRAHGVSRIQSRLPSWR